MPPYIQSGSVLIDAADGHTVDRGELRQIAAEMAVKAGVDPDIFIRQINQESGFNINAHNDGSGAHGIAQVMPATGAQPGYGVAPVDSSDPIDSLRFAAQYMKAMLNETGGDYTKALAAYNGGLGNVLNGNYLDPNWAGYGENSNYTSTILGGNTMSGSGRGGDYGTGTSSTTVGAGVTAGSDPTDPEYWKRIGKAPPWIDAGYPNFQLYVDAVGAKTALANAHSAATIALQEKQLNSSTRDSSASLAQNQRQFDITNARLIAAAASGDENAKAQLAENRRQFDETFGMNKAEFNMNFTEKQRQFNASQDLHRGDTLLGLGSRPDTLIKYLYAIRGQQTPQAVAGTTTNLPGFKDVVGQPRPGAVPGQTGAVTPPVEAPTLTGPAPGPGNNAPPGTSLIPGTPYVGAGGAGNPTPDLASGGMTIPGTSLTQGTSTAALTQQAAANGGVVAGPGGIPIYTPGTTPPVGAGVGPGGGGLPGNNSAGAPFTYGVGVAPPPAPGGGTYSGVGVPLPTPMHFAHGGVIPEPVIGIGMHSGQTYTFGERGPETVVPGQGQQPTGDGSYAAGGTIGYNGLTGGRGGNASAAIPGLSADVFNPSNLPSIVARGYNSTPNVPFFPQIGIATNGGQSLIPSAQRLNSLTPTEQGLYSGALTDEFGVQPEDVFSMSRRLAPKVSGLRTPNFAN